MELERLARGDAQRMIGVPRGDAIQRQPLRGRDHSTRRTGADHELVRRFELLPTPLIADVAIVLLIAAVVLDQGLIVLAQRTGHRIGQALFQRPAQTATFGFDVFDGVSHGNRESGMGNRKKRLGLPGKVSCGLFRFPIPPSRFPALIDITRIPPLHLQLGEIRRGGFCIHGAVGGDDVEQGGVHVLAHADRPAHVQMRTALQPGVDLGAARRRCCT